MSEEVWREHGSLFKDAGDYGGEVQVGKSFSRRFVHATLPGRLVEVVAYPIETAGPGDDEKSITLEWQTIYTVCRNIEDPGSTEISCASEYSDLPERFDGVYPTVEAAELGAHGLILSMEPKHIGWDGAPEISLARYLDTLRMLSSVDPEGDPIARAQLTIERNNSHPRAHRLDWDYALVTDPDGSRTVVAWVFDTQDMRDPDLPGGEVVVCWWAARKED